MIKIDRDSQGRLIEKEIDPENLTSTEEDEHSASSKESCDESATEKLDPDANINISDHEFPGTFIEQTFAKYIEPLHPISPFMEAAPTDANASPSEKVTLPKPSSAESNNSNEDDAFKILHQSDNSSIQADTSSSSSSSQCDSIEDMPKNTYGIDETNSSSDSSRSSFQLFSSEKNESHRHFKILENDSQKFIDKINARLCLLSFNNYSILNKPLQNLKHDLEMYHSKWKKRLAYVLNEENQGLPISREVKNTKCNNNQFVRRSHSLTMLKHEPNSHTFNIQRKSHAYGISLGLKKENNQLGPFSNSFSYPPSGIYSKNNKENKLYLQNTNLPHTQKLFHFPSIFSALGNFNSTVWMSTYLKKYLVCILILLCIGNVLFGSISSKAGMTSFEYHQMKEEILSEMKKSYKDAHLDMLIFLEKSSRKSTDASIEAISKYMQDIKNDVTAFKSKVDYELKYNQMFQEELITELNDVHGQLDQFSHHHQNLINTYSSKFTDIFQKLEAAGKENAYLHQIVEKLDSSLHAQLTHEFQKVEERNSQLIHQVSQLPEKLRHILEGMPRHNSTPSFEKPTKQTNQVFDNFLNDAYNFFKSRFAREFPTNQKPSPHFYEPQASSPPPGKMNFQSCIKKHASQLLDKTLGSFHKFNSFVQSSFQTISKAKPSSWRRPSEYRKIMGDKFHQLLSNVNRFSSCLKKSWKQIYKRVFHPENNNQNCDSMNDSPSVKFDYCTNKAFQDEETLKQNEKYRKL